MAVTGAQGSGTLVLDAWDDDSQNKRESHTSTADTPDSQHSSKQRYFAVHRCSEHRHNGYYKLSPPLQPLSRRRAGRRGSMWRIRCCRSVLPTSRCRCVASASAHCEGYSGLRPAGWECADAGEPAGAPE